MPVLKLSLSQGGAHAVGLADQPVVLQLRAFLEGSPIHYPRAYSCLYA